MQVISFTSLMPLLSIFLFCCTSQTLRASLLNVWPMNQQQWPPLEAGWKGKILGSTSKFSESALNMILRWFTHTLKWEKHYSVPAKSSQSCSTLCDPMDCSLWGSSVHGILQAKILGWTAMPLSRGSSWHWDQTSVSLCLLHCRRVLYHLSHQGSHQIFDEGWVCYEICFLK